MKKLVLYSVCAATLLTGCDSAGDGAVTGAGLGAILGSAIGGISGGPRGSDIGTLFGMAGGAVAGAAVGSANERAQQEKYRQYREIRDAQYGRANYGYGSDNYGYSTGSYANGTNQSAYNQSNGGYFDPTNSGDDRIEMEPSTDTATAPKSGQAAGQSNGREAYTTVTPRTLSVDQLEHAIQGYRIEYNSLIEVRNATFVDSNGDGILHAGETSKVTFEIMNSSDVTLYDVQPTVVETTGNKHVHISPGLRVESIAPHRGVRYTATVFADKRLKNGQIILKIAVVQGNHEITSQIKEFVVTTSKR